MIETSRMQAVAPRANPRMRTRPSSVPSATATNKNISGAFLAMCSISVMALLEAPTPPAAVVPNGRFRAAAFGHDDRSRYLRRSSWTLGQLAGGGGNQNTCGGQRSRRSIISMLDTYLLMLAALFPVVNPPGSALVFLTMTKRASTATRRILARRVAINAFFVMVASLLVGASVLKVYGISIPVLRIAGGLVVAASGWTLLSSGSSKEEATLSADSKVEYASQAFYPLTMPLTTGPGTIAVMISLGLSRSAFTDPRAEFAFLIGGLLATATIAAAIYLCFSFADGLSKWLGRGGTDIAVRLSAFILFCLGVQIVWTGVSDLLRQTFPAAV